MALKVWLPLNGNLDNLGTRRPTIALVGTPTVNNNGKIGQCYTFSGSNGISVAEQVLPSQAPEWSFACWFKLANTTSTAAAALFSERTGGNQYGYTIFLYPNNSKMLIDDGVRWTVTPMTFSANVWYHLVITRSSTGKKLYVNGELKSSITTVGSTSAVNANGCLIGLAQSGTSLTAGNQGFIGDLNDVRIYDHCLSALEVKEISQGLILHYKLSSQKDVPNDNLFLKTRMTATDRSGWVKNNSTDFTKLIRYYNGSSGIHSFAALPDGEYEDTVTLSATGNLGIAFLRSATDINLDSNSYYTLSCEAKCNVAGKSLAIGTSYYTTGNAWTWRGGANAKAFTAVDTWQTFTLTFKPDANTQYICYCFTVNQGTANSAEKFTIRHCKLEKGSEATKWLPAPEELESGASSNEIIDSSGYGNNGTASSTLTVQRDSNRYGSSTLLDQKKITCSPCFPQTADPIFTVSLWFKLYSNITYTSYADLISIPATNSSQLFRLEICGSPAGTNIQWFRGPTGTSGGFGVGSTTSGWYTLDEWHHTVLVGEGNKQYTCYFDGVQTNTYNGSANSWTPTGAIALGDTIQGTANFSDFRVYTTALSAEDVANLYHTSAHIDKLGKAHAFEFVEDTNGKELLSIPWTSSYTTHNKTSLWNTFNENGEWTFNTYSSASSDYIKINPSGKTYYWDAIISVATGNQFYIGFERYDAAKTSRSNNATVYIINKKPTTDITYERFFGTVDLSTDTVNPTDTITLRVLNKWTNSTSSTTGLATIHYLSLREVEDTPKTGSVKKNGQFITDEFIERNGIGSLYKNGIGGFTNIIEK